MGSYERAVSDEGFLLEGMVVLRLRIVVLSQAVRTSPRIAKGKTRLKMEKILRLGRLKAMKGI